MTDRRELMEEFEVGGMDILELQEPHLYEACRQANIKGKKAKKESTKLLGRPTPLIL